VYYCSLPCKEQDTTDKSIGANNDTGRMVQDTNGNYGTERKGKAGHPEGTKEVRSIT